LIKGIQSLNSKKYNGNQKGVTLMELMIVVAIIGIIAAVAYPSYQEFVMKSRRADAQAALVSFAGAMERHFTGMTLIVVREQRPWVAAPMLLVILRFFPLNRLSTERMCTMIWILPRQEQLHIFFRQPPRMLRQRTAAVI